MKKKQQNKKFKTHLNNIKWFFIESKDELKWKLQEIFRGHSDPQMWNMDYCIATKILPAFEHHLKRAKEEYLPLAFEDNQEEWYQILDKIHYYLKLRASDDYYKVNHIPQIWHKIEEGRKLFGKHFHEISW
jgi:hypothetical protein